MKTYAFDFTGRIALVTGASRGIGAAIARALAAHNATVILASRKIEGLREVEHEIASSGGAAYSIPCHTGDLTQIESLFQTIEERWGGIDLLVNNAATNPYFGEMLGVDEGVWDKTMAVNLKGYFFIAQKAARMMKERKGGAIVNVASINGIRPAPGQGIYSISKAAVISMTRAFAKELAPYGIRVNALLPGLTDTKFSSVMTSNEAILNAILPAIPMHRIAKPEEMVGAALYLLSDMASYTTGSLIVADGGMIA